MSCNWKKTQKAGLLDTSNLYASRRFSIHIERHITRPKFFVKPPVTLPNTATQQHSCLPWPPWVTVTNRNNSNCLASPRLPVPLSCVLITNVLMIIVFMLSVLMLSVHMLSVLMLSVLMLSASTIMLCVLITSALMLSASAIMLCVLITSVLMLSVLR
jgi:hypothetical protein